LSYQILPNVIFILSVLGILLIILRHLPEAAAADHSSPKEPSAHFKLVAKGLPAEAFSKIGVILRFRVRKIWNFMLEAKDLKPYSNVGYKMKKIFGGRQPQEIKPVILAPVTTHEVRNENYYLEMIRIQPRKLSHYDALGKFYLEQENFNDSKDIYLYLANHEPANPDFQARLAYCYYQVKQFAKAADHYQKSIALDSTQPNRYYNLGLSLESAGKAAAAAAALNKALELEPENPKYKAAYEKVKKLV